MTGFIKRIARWVLRKELAEKQELVDFAVKAAHQATSRALSHEREARRQEGLRIEQANKLSRMKVWGQKTGITYLIAWHDYITTPHADSRAFGIVHPFDRWDVRPKPGEVCG